MSATIMERFQLIKVLDPVANAFAATPTVEVIDMSDFTRLLFVRHDGVGAAGTSTVTVEACSNIAAGATTPVPFLYREITTGDTEGAITAGTAGTATWSFVTTAGSSKLIAIEVDEDVVAATGYAYVRCKFVEATANAVLGGVLAFGEKKVARATANSAID